jgi:hypothetical protein
MCFNAPYIFQCSVSVTHDSLLLSMMNKGIINLPVNWYSKQAFPTDTYSRS